ncbi:MFS transporter [Haloarchaeobius sp. HRN-SO-5]|uniref:MFS transporter n=1 Tax=Haloarchaeobius sp. HRN-SO-5 TaxID=3446118 RepID=UPI003EBFF246
MSDQRAGGRVPWRNRTVQAVLASTLVAPLGVPLLSPALPVVRDHFGLTDPEASLLVSSYFVVGIFVSPFIGLGADRLGRKRVLLPALLVFSLTGLTGYVAPSYAVLLGLRVVQGTAAAALFVTTVTIIGDAFEGVQRNAVLGVNVAALSLGAAVFPVLGGALAGVAWNVPFLAYGLGLPVALFAAVAIQEHPRPGPSSDDRKPTAEHAAGRTESASTGEEGGVSYLRGVLGRLTTAMVALLTTAFLTEFVLFGALFTALPFLLTASYALTPVYIGGVLLATEGTAIVAAAANGRLAGAISNGRLIASGFGCYGLSLLGIYLAPSPLLVAVASLLFGVGLGLTMPSVDAAISQRVSTSYRAGLLGLRNSTTFLGRATGPVVFATGAALVGYPLLLLVSGVSLVVIAVVASVATTASRVPGTPNAP